MKFLSYDGLPARILRYLWNLFLLNVCLCLCCLPVITAGAAMSAAYAVFLEPSDPSDMVPRFFRALRENGKRATVLWLVLLAAAGVLGLDWYFLLVFRFPGNGILIFLTAAVTAAYLSTAAFVFPLQARYENPVGRTLKNAFLLGLSRFFSGILTALVFAAPLLLFAWDLDIFIRVLAVWLPLGTALQIQIAALLMGRVLRKLEPQ